MKLRGISDKGLKRIAQFTSPDEGAFRLEELGDKERERALQQYIQYLPEDWSEYTIEDAKEYAPPYFEVNDVIFSGFASQGDGASWNGTVDFLKWCEVQGNEVCADLIRKGYTGEGGEIALNPGNHYMHSGGMTLDEDVSSDYIYDSEEEIPGAEEAIQEMHDEVLAEAREYADKIYRDLEETYEAETSLEAFEDMAAGNDWLFDADGNLA